MTPQDRFKRDAAVHAASLVASGMVVGLGTGSTTQFALERLGELIRTGALRDIVGIPSSVRTETTARDLGIPLTDFEAHPVIDLTIDGADEVDPDLNLIKGGGGALLREKIVAQVSRRVIIVVDETKPSPRLGTHWPVPVEVIPFGWRSQARYLESLGATYTIRQQGNGSQFVTDSGNMILDCHFGPIADVRGLAATLGARAGIVEHGLFIDLATDLIVAGPGGVRYTARTRVALMTG